MPQDCNKRIHHSSSSTPRQSVEGSKPSDMGFKSQMSGFRLWPVNQKLCRNAAGVRI